MSLKAKLFSLLNIIQKLSYVLLVFFLYLFLSNDSRVLVIATIVSSLICSILCIFIERKVLFARIKPTSNLNLLKLMKYGFPYIFSNALTWILEYMDKITIRKYCNFNEVGIYSAAGTIVALLTTCQLAFSTFWVPTAYKKYEEDSNSAVYFIKVNRIISFIMIVLGLCLVTSKDIIIYILGSEYRNSVFVFPFLSFMPIMFTISETTVMGINFTQKSYFHIVIAFIAAICNFIGNINLVPIYGAKGAAISTGFSYIVLFVARTYFSIKCYKCDYNIKTIVIPVTMLSVLSIYSSFNKFNLNIAVGSLLSIALTIYLYKDVVFEIIHLILKMYHSRISLYKIKKM
jgi:putative cofactor-binding repeat protein